MILSKKYIESMNKITVDDNLKKKILEEVSKVNKEEKESNSIYILKKKKINRFGRRYIGITAACCAFVICTGLNIKFPELFNVNNVNVNSENEDVKDNDLQVNNENALENKNDDINNNFSSKVEKPVTEDEEVYSDNVGKEKKSESNTIQPSNRQIANGKKNDASVSYKEITNQVANEKEQAEYDNSKNQAVNESKENISNKNELPVVSRNNEKEYLQNDMSEVVNSEVNNGNTISSSRSATEETLKSGKSNLKIPEFLEKNYEIAYSSVVSENEIRLGYKDKEYGSGEITISSKEIDNNKKKYRSIEDVKTSKGIAVIKVSENGNEKYADWKYNNIYYSLCTNENIDNGKIIHIIESCV